MTIYRKEDSWWFSAQSIQFFSIMWTIQGFCLLKIWERFPTEPQRGSEMLRHHRSTDRFTASSVSRFGVFLLHSHQEWQWSTFFCFSVTLSMDLCFFTRQEFFFGHRNVALNLWFPIEVIEFADLCIHRSWLAPQTSVLVILLSLEKADKMLSEWIKWLLYEGHSEVASCCYWSLVLLFFQFISMCLCFNT